MLSNTLNSEIDLPRLTERYQDLPFDLPHPGVTTYLVVGAGGIGSWTTLFLANMGYDVIVVDPDTVEASNLIRTPYSVYDVDRPKVDALVDVVRRLQRGDIGRVFAYQGRLSQVSGLITIQHPAVSAVIDTADNTAVLRVSEEYARQRGARLYWARYDGEYISVHSEPPSSVFLAEDTTGYETVPSYLPPAVITAALVVDAAVRGREISIDLPLSRMQNKYFDLLRSLQEEDSNG